MKHPGAFQVSTRPYAAYWLLLLRFFPKEASLLLELYLHSALTYSQSRKGRALSQWLSLIFSVTGGIQYYAGHSSLIRGKSLTKRQPESFLLGFLGWGWIKFMCKAVTETWNGSILTGLDQWLSNFSVYQNPLRGFWKHTLLGPI